MIRRNRAQRWWVYVIDGDTGYRATGQAASVTATICKDSDAFVATTDVNPTEVGTSGYYYFDLTAAETNAASVDIVPVHSSSKYVVVPLDSERWTRVDANVVSANDTAVLVGDLNFTVSAGGRMVNKTLDLVPGDEYQEADGTGVSFTDSRFPDLDLFSTAELTVTVNGTAVLDHISTASLDEASKTVTVELTEAQTTLLASYTGLDAFFDLELVRADATRKTVARGPVNVLDPLG